MENHNVEFFIEQVNSILKQFDYEGYNDIEEKYEDIIKNLYVES